MATRIRIDVLPDHDLSRLREIVDFGTVDGCDDPAVIVKYLASAILQIAKGQKQTPHAIQDVLDAAGLGR